ncbi:MAG: dTMP kinase [Gammaproteobacteria bacterium]|nr:dTMP kinase [Gammaproteobacteria bacterium]
MNRKFITLEGLEGAGKSTQTAEIADYLRGKGLEVYITQEPGGTQLGEKIRQWLLDPEHRISEMTELLLFYAARVQHIEQQIKPALQEGRWVVCDRFIDSSYAYQGGGRGIPLDYIEKLNRLSVSITPDLTLLLDIKPKHIWQRIDIDNRDRFERENTAFFQRVRNSYLQCAGDNPERIRIIDAEQSIAQVAQTIIEQLEPLIEAP